MQAVKREKFTIILITAENDSTYQNEMNSLKSQQSETKKSYSYNLSQLCSFDIFFYYTSIVLQTKNKKYYYGNIANCIMRDKW